jgi:hypothetical protein
MRIPLWRALALTKLIFWLAGLLVAIVTMNITVYLGLTAVYLGGRAVKRLAARRLGFDARDESSENLPPGD